MKALLLCGLALSLTATSQGSGYAPNDGTAKPGNPGTYTTPKAGMGNAAPTTSGRGTDVNGPATMGTSATAPNSGSPAGAGASGSVPGSDMATGYGNANLEKANTSVTPIPTDTTLQGNSTQTGPYKTGKHRQQQESNEEELDYRAIEGVNHDEQNASENQ